ncbi:MAG: hypothetical protein JW908_00515 [Anaerolineales bacterium]|nr:hypothetical protein [Anaerolineales bacterium]
MARNRGILGKGSISKDASTLRVLMAGAATPAGTTDHGDLAGLSDDDHAQYMHLSADRTVTAQHQFAPTTDKAPFTLGAHAQGQKVTGLNADLLDGADASSFISVISSPTVGNFPVMTSGGELETSAYGPSSFVPTSRTVTAGAGLTGGGALSSDIALAVGAGTLISVGENTVGITPGSARYQFIVSGASPFSAAWSAGFLNIASGKTLTLSADLTSQTGAGVLSWPEGGAIGTIPTTGTFAMGAGTLAVGSTDSYSGASHTHAITTSSAVTTETSVILATDGSGVLRLYRLGIGCAPDAQYGLDVAGSIHTSSYFVGRHAMEVEGALMLCHYDGQRPFETDYTGEATGHMGQVANIEGGLIFRPGVFYKGVQIAEAATNLCANPSFETNTTGWGKSPDVDLTRSNDYSYFGSYSAKVVREEGDGVIGIYRTTQAFTSGQVYILSFYVRKSDGSEVTTSDIAAIFIENSQVGVNSIQAVENNWYRVVSNTRTAIATGNSNFGVYSGVGTYYFDGFLLINSSYTMPYLDGSLGSGHTWSGTAHASTSARTAAVLYYTNPLEADEGTIQLHWIPSSANDTAQTSPYLFSEGNLEAYYLAADDKIYFTDGTNTISTDALTFDADAAQYLAFSWSSDGLAIRRYYNGTMDTTVTGATYTAPTLGTYLYVGSDDSKANQCNGIIDDLGVMDHAYTDAEFLAIAKSGAPIFAETSTWAWRAAGNLGWADQYGIWVIDTTGGAVFGVYGASGTKSWGGFTMSTGDIVLGNNVSGSAAILWDVSEGTFGFYGDGGATAQVEIATNGSLTFGGGVGYMDADGIHITAPVSWTGADPSTSDGYSLEKTYGTTEYLGGVFAKFDTSAKNAFTYLSSLLTGDEAGSMGDSKLRMYSLYDCATGNENMAEITIWSSSSLSRIDMNADDGVNIYDVAYINDALGISTTARQTLSIGSYLDLYSGNPNSPTVPSIRASTGNNLVLNAYSTGGVYLNYDGGTGGIRFHGGSSTEVGSIDSSGNMQLDGYVNATGYINTTDVYKVDSVQVVSTQFVSRYANNPVDTNYGSQEANLLDALRDCVIHHGLMVYG